ncbi:acyl-CoA dehydrogenase C-terminal domain-containing protein [Pseudoxanthobacter sp.]|uniref:acyl-CoA dehydrogenase C-terminal domain-containing protein n=1 Tax=Pseudoxanthobacter sp. TaxID=1925742 RepID=UPI002FE3A91C
MPSYKAPVDDMAFLLNEVFDFDAEMAALPGYEEISAELAVSVLEEAGKFCTEVVQPLNLPADIEGAKLVDGVVHVPKGFDEAYKAFAEAGWQGLSGDPEYGGQGLPRAVQILFDEMLSGANLSFGLIPGLTRGASEAIHHHASDALKALYLPKMLSGEWSGAMALTESSAGTDLGLLKTRAVPNGDGTYAVSGSKIFISSGDHELVSNIIHLVLARLPDAPAGVKGISLFLVPKFLPDADGNPGQRNTFSVGALEHKMGIHAQPTCVMNYDGSTGWLVGEPHRGLAAMFTMMNAERLFVGIEGLGVADAAYQNAAAYAHDRLQGRSVDGKIPLASIVHHPDVRKMLLTIRGYTEAARALALFTALEMDKSSHSTDAAVRAVADGRIALLTPVIKAAFTDFGFQSAVIGQQVFGGHGYIREWGMEQFVRDARITQIYEGTNGVQAMDLVGRKLFMNNGALQAEFFALVKADLAAIAANPAAVEFTAPAAAALARLEAATALIVADAAGDPAATGAAATDYLRFFALTAFAWMWARMADKALKGDSVLHRNKLGVARFFMARMLPETLGLEAALKAGSATLMNFDTEAF